METAVNIKPAVGISEQPGSRSALLGMLPFLLFGLLSMLTKSQLPFSAAYVYITFYVISLLGLLIGMARGVPRWTYSYLGWSLFCVWWWTMMPVDIFSASPSLLMQNERLGWRAALPFLFTIGLALLSARSLRPVRQLADGIWQQWTLFSLMMYTFAAFTQLIYDENHHPFLFGFILASTAAISIAVWIFLRSNRTWQQALALFAGFMAAWAISSLSYATWDWAAYYGFPEAAPQAWYVSAWGILQMSLVWVVILFWPALLGLLQRAQRQQPAM